MTTCVMSVFKQTAQERTDGVESARSSLSAHWLGVSQGLPGPRLPSEVVSWHPLTRRGQGRTRLSGGVGGAWPVGLRGSSVLQAQGQDESPACGPPVPLGSSPPLLGMYAGLVLGSEVRQNPGQLESCLVLPWGRGVGGSNSCLWPVAMLSPRGTTHLQPVFLPSRRTVMGLAWVGCQLSRAVGEGGRGGQPCPALHECHHPAPGDRAPGHRREQALGGLLQKGCLTRAQTWAPYFTRSPRGPAW